MATLNQVFFFFLIRLYLWCNLMIILIKTLYTVIILKIMLEDTR